MDNTSTAIDSIDARRVLVLFDVDGTLVPPRGRISTNTSSLIRELRSAVQVGFIGGSTMSKAIWQLGATAKDDFDYAFAECGVVSWRNGVELPTESLINLVGEDKYKALVNFILHYIADLDLPIKRGTFIEYRQGLLNICPQGRDTTPEEQERFEEYDKVHDVRGRMIQALRDAFPTYNLVCAIGGRTSFDLFPRGWDKTYALRHIDLKAFDAIHYLGDKTTEGGNDYEMYHHPALVGHTVRGPADTERIIRELLYKYSNN